MTFKQIMAAGAGEVLLYGLDTEGKVWWYNVETDQWVEIGRHDTGE
jgi:hypothetical protein